MKQKLYARVFSFLGVIGVTFTSSLSIIGMYEPQKPKKLLN